MNIYLAWVLIFLAAILIGALLSLIVLIPSIRQAGRENNTIRRVLIGLLSLLAFGVVFIGGTRLFAGFMVRSISDTIDDARKLAIAESQEAELITEWDLIKDDALTELWLRQLFPDQGWPCRTRQLTLCEQMGKMGIWGVPSWGIYTLYILVGLVSAVSSGISASRFTWQEEIVSSSKL
jgi:hypothetical protein